MKLRFFSLFMRVFAIVFLLSCMLIFVVIADDGCGVWCKDCGNENNCWQGNHLDSGYQDCWIDKYDKCHVEFCGNCEQLPGGGSN